jgi:hypothetical protein
MAPWIKIVCRQNVNGAHKSPEAAVGRCRQDVNSTCSDDRGRGWAFMDPEGLLTCDDAPSSGVQHCPGLRADVGAFGGS